MRIAFSGDWHGFETPAADIIYLCGKAGVRKLFQVGDFGFWPGAKGSEYLDTVEMACAAAEITLYWIDGNHDWHDEIGRLTDSHGFLSPIEIRNRVHYLPRGCRITVSGLKFGALGGAFSVDWRWRKPYISWWPEELIKGSDVDRLGDDKLDVLLTHTSPVELPISSWVLTGSDADKADNDHNCVAQAIRQTRPSLLVHGHWHHCYISTFPHRGGVTEVWGLGESLSLFKSHTRIVDIADGKLTPLWM